MNPSLKKEQVQAYKTREKTGGIYVVRNLKNDKLLLLSTMAIDNIKGRFEFSQKTNTCPYMKLKPDWDKFGKEAFEIEILETLEKTATQTDSSYKEDIKWLLEMWQSRIPEEGRY